MGPQVGGNSQLLGVHREIGFPGSRKLQTKNEKPGLETKRRLTDQTGGFVIVNEKDQTSQQFSPILEVYA